MLPGKLDGGNFISLIKRWQTMWNNVLLEHLQSMRLVAGHGIRIQKLASGTVISAERAGAAIAGSAASMETEGGPFAVTADLTTNDDSGELSWIILMHNSNSDSGKAGMVTIGRYREVISDRKWDARAGVVYLDVTYNDEDDAYTVIFDLEDELPDTEDEKRFILRIAEILHDTENDTYTVCQIQPFGDIEILGRWVK